VKINPNNQTEMITPSVNVGLSSTQISTQIKHIKKALKQPELYTDEEIRYLKRSLTELREEKRSLNKGYGFGN
tara:strand:+ start:117 stop:335 length:219 start_codon:yes stop_codon:yes gene_type:complete